MKQAKKLVKYVKLVGLNQQVKENGGVTLYQSTIVRWLSLCDLLESVVKSFKIIRKLLIGKEKQRLIIDLNLQYLKQLCTILKPFKHAIVSIQIGGAPSLYLASMHYAALKDVLQSFESVKKYNEENIDVKKENRSFDDSTDDDLEQELPGIKWFRERLLVLLTEMIVLDIRHVAATFLNPRYRSLKKLPDYVKEQCFQYIRRKIRQIREKQAQQQHQKQFSEPQNKRLKVEKDFFARFESASLSEEFADNNTSGNETEEYDYSVRKGDELDRYRLFEFDKNKKTQHPLDFWKKHQETFPFLSKRTDHSGYDNQTVYKLNIFNDTAVLSAVFCLQSLKHFYLDRLPISDAEVTHLPSQFGKLEYLVSLELSNTDLVSLPNTMANLWSLSMLYLSNSKLTTLPVAIGKIKSLTCINLDNSTNICSIQSINGLPNLHMLSTLNCGITNILLNLPNICYLDMSNNRLTNLVGIKTLGSNYYRL
ncbi:unnamed protein product [Rotaria magnacalcarata]|uniref:Disease resistance R13L4/SHOC-2-like LRR domain-containing protein n=2 Tax=Rotaria magnacalcarata TaxID=392030 RepID=A0A816TTP2_9BILA|nr:unnamed protein product [Rotaria magnacalcarata]